MSGEIFECFEIKERQSLEYGAAGVVVIFRHAADVTPPQNGDPILLVRPDGWMFQSRAEDVRHESTQNATGFFVRGLKLTDVPAGTTVRWGQAVTEIQAKVA
jgi:hypothetical protein